MKLATVEDVLARMQLQNMVGVGNTASIESALDSATPMIESIIRTTIALASRIDYFDNTRGLYETFSPSTIILTQRYLTSVTVEVYNTPNNGELLDDLSGLTPIDAQYYYVDKKKGTVRILGDLNTSYAGLAVKYTAGFNEGSPTIPYWMREAAISAAVFINHTHSVTHSKKDAVDMSKPLSGIIYTNVNEHIYTPYDGSPPIRAEEV